MKRILAVTLLLLTACRTPEPALQQSAPAPQILFLLTFDDGPSIREDYNPTLAILNQLATNDIQPGIKALFFVQTEHPRGGGTPRGRDIMRTTHEQGHVLGIHSASAKGHISHTSQPDAELIPELRQAQDVLEKITGTATRFVRPPYGACDIRTRTIYDQLGLEMLMSNVRAKDGIIYGFNGSLQRRSNIFKSLKALRTTADPDAVTYAVINFHDINPYTARHMTEYLHILVEEAHRAGFAVPKKPFCSSPEEIARVVEVQKVPLR